jgi:mannose-1-phosphate guanylyltransferase
VNAMNTAHTIKSHGRAAIILAGGDGTRLRSLTRRIAGADVPKQFCPVLGSETLWERTRTRASLSVADEATVSVLTRSHAAFFEPLRNGMPAENLIVQPENRGTAPAILYGLLRIATRSRAASVAVLPSDHFVSDEREFMRHVDRAFDAVEARPEAAVLLGMAPAAPEPGYGWIEPGELMVRQAPLFRVRRFWEKPRVDVAAQLLRGGCLWNSFVMVARVSTLLAMMQAALPELFGAFAAVRGALGTESERGRIDELYSRIAPSNFSHEVLEGQPAHLAVLPVHGIEWSDLGEPERVIGVLSYLGLHPEWAA